MRSKLLICLWLSVLTAVCLAQDDKAKARPDFSGSWVLDASKSEFGRGGGGAGSNVTGTMTVTMKDAEFRLSRKMKFNEQERTMDFLYYTDERGETNPGTFGPQEVKSKTKWDGSKIVSKASVSRTMPSGDEVNFDMDEKWELSDDGKVLTDTLTISAPMGTRTIKHVYNRAS